MLKGTKLSRVYPVWKFMCISPIENCQFYSIHSKCYRISFQTTFISISTTIYNNNNNNKKRKKNLQKQDNNNNISYVSDVRKRAFLERMFSAIYANKTAFASYIFEKKTIYTNKYVYKYMCLYVCEIDICKCVCVCALKDILM